jgi:phenol/toluene 2-monooxygenase (NADH) P4/A4
MPVQAIRSDYVGEVKDRIELFHGNQLVYVSWDQHNMVCAPVAFPLPPAMPFGALVDQVLAGSAYAAHPDWPKVDWKKVEWFKSKEPFQPAFTKSLADNGIGHKTLLRFRTPGLAGIGGSHT